MEDGGIGGLKASDVRLKGKSREKEGPIVFPFAELQTLDVHLNDGWDPILNRKRKKNAVENSR